MGTTALSFTSDEVREDLRIRSVSAALPLEAINIPARQMRETYTGIDELAEAIIEQGQLEPGIAAALTPHVAARFLRDLNDLWGTGMRLADLVRIRLDDELYYVILVAGHRRYHACEKAREQKPDLRYRVELRLGMRAEEALSIQFTENMHVRVPPHEEANSIALSWKWLKKRHPNMTLAAFSRRLNRSSSWVAGALRFVELPQELQECAGDRRLTYGVLLQFARLIDGMHEMQKPLSDGEIQHWVSMAILHRWDEAEMRMLVTKRLFEATHEQLGLFGDATFDERPLRRVVAEHLIRGVLDFLTYLEQLQTHRLKGGFADESYFDPETDPVHVESYSLGSPLRLLERSVRYLESELPHFEQLAAEHGGRHRHALKEGRSVVRRARQLVSRVPTLNRRRSERRPDRVCGRGVLFL